MRRSTIILTVLVIIVGAAVAEYLWSRHTAAVREAGYQTALRSFEAAFRRGMTRKDVESYLRHNEGFVQLCCMNREGNTWDDLIKIGEEPPPFLCDADFVFIGLAFRRTDGQFPVMPDAHDADVLTDIRIFHQLQRCL